MPVSRKQMRVPKVAHDAAAGIASNDKSSGNTAFAVYSLRISFWVEYFAEKTLP